MNLFEDQTRSLNPIKMLVKSILICTKLEMKLEILEINRCLVVYERGKSAPVVETNTGSW